MQNQRSLVSTSQGSSSASTSTGNRIDFAPEQVGDFSPTQFKDFLGKAENRVTKSSDRPQQDLVFLEDSNPLSGVPEAIKGIPPAIFKIFGDTIQEFDDSDRPQWLRNVEKPKCKLGTFAFCCNQGAPNPQRMQTRFSDQNRKTTAEEILKRRRKCSKCTFGDIPFIPERFFLLGDVLICSTFEL